MWMCDLRQKNKKSNFLLLYLWSLKVGAEETLHLSSVLFWPFFPASLFQFLLSEVLQKWKRLKCVIIICYMIRWNVKPLVAKTLSILITRKLQNKVELLKSSHLIHSCTFFSLSHCLIWYIVLYMNLRRKNVSRFILLYTF